MTQQNKSILKGFGIAALAGFTIGISAYFLFNSLLENRVGHYLKINNLSYEKVQCKINPRKWSDSLCKVSNLSDNQDLKVEETIIKNPMGYLTLQRTFNTGYIEPGKNIYKITFKNIYVKGESLNSLFQKNILATNLKNKNKLAKELDGNNSISIESGITLHGFSDFLNTINGVEINIGNIESKTKILANIKQSAVKTFIELKKTIEQRKTLTMPVINDPKITALQKELIRKIILSEILVHIDFHDKELFKNSLDIPNTILTKNELMTKVIKKLKELNEGKTSEIIIDIKNPKNLTLMETEAELLLAFMTHNYDKMINLYKIEIK